MRTGQSSEREMWLPQREKETKGVIWKDKAAGICTYKIGRKQLIPTRTAHCRVHGIERDFQRIGLVDE